MSSNKHLIWIVAAIGLVLGWASFAFWLPVDASKLREAATENTYYLPLLFVSSCIPGPPVTPDDVERDLSVEARINEIRLSNDLPVLAKSARITQAALRHSNDMADNNFFDHAGSDGTFAGDRLDKACYNWQAYGEIIAAGYKSPSGVVAAWMDSPGHRSIILDPGYADFGAGYAYKESSRYKHYWTVDFGLLAPEHLSAAVALHECTYHQQNADGELWISLFASQPCEDFGALLESNIDRD